MQHKKENQRTFLDVLPKMETFLLQECMKKSQRRVIEHIPRYPLPKFGYKIQLQGQCSFDGMINNAPARSPLYVISGIDLNL